MGSNSGELLVNAKNSFYKGKVILEFVQEKNTGDYERIVCLII